MLDGDLKRFADGLNQTPPGLRLRLAVHEARIAIQQIRRLAALNDPRTKKAIDTWRQAYIKACNNGSTAVDRLWEEHQWPPDAARARDYEYRPMVDFKR